ncbi:hypothetical protein pb186bvf_003925 [Paramecium bursaria]
MFLKFFPLNQVLTVFTFYLDSIQQLNLKSGETYKGMILQTIFTSDYKKNFTQKENIFYKLGINIQCRILDFMVFASNIGIYKYQFIFVDSFIKKFKDQSDDNCCDWKNPFIIYIQYHLLLELKNIMMNFRQDSQIPSSLLCMVCYQICDVPFTCKMCRNLTCFICLFKNQNCCQICGSNRFKRIDPIILSVLLKIKCSCNYCGLSKNYFKFSNHIHICDILSNQVKLEEKFTKQNQVIYENCQECQLLIIKPYKCNICSKNYCQNCQYSHQEQKILLKCNYESLSCILINSNEQSIHNNQNGLICNQSKHLKLCWLNYKHLHMISNNPQYMEYFSYINSICISYIVESQAFLFIIFNRKRYNYSIYDSDNGNKVIVQQNLQLPSDSDILEQLDDQFICRGCLYRLFLYFNCYRNLGFIFTLFGISLALNGIKNTFKQSKGSFLPL